MIKRRNASGKIRIDIVRKLGSIVCGMCVVSIGAVYLGIMQHRRRGRTRCIGFLHIPIHYIATMYYYH